MLCRIYSVFRDLRTDHCSFDRAASPPPVRKSRNFSLGKALQEAQRILQGCPFGEGHLHDVLVSLACADHPVVRPHRDPSPLPLLDHFGIGFLDQGPEPAKHLAPPVAKFADSRVYQLRSGLAFRGLLPPLIVDLRFLSRHTTLQLVDRSVN